MRTPTVLAALMCSTLVITTTLALAAPVQLPRNRDVYIDVSNDNGALYGLVTDGTYWLNAPGGGLNQLHIDSTPGSASGNVTTQNINTSSTSGTFWVTTTGGRGYNDDLILLFSLPGPISDDFRLQITSSGYQWTASAAGVVSPVYKNGAIDEIFTKDDFLYGPHTAKPGPGNAWVLPFYPGQDINDPSTAQYLLFIDLYVGNTRNAANTPIDSGNAKVEFEISGIYETTAAFNAYAWAFSAMIANSSINWTNNSLSGYVINTTAVAPTAVPEPAVIWLFGSGLISLFVLRRKNKH